MRRPNRLFWEALAEARIEFLYSCPWPPQGFYTIKEAKVPEDVNGLKFPRL